MSWIFGGPNSPFNSNREEGNVLFDALNTFYLRLYGVRHIKDHSARKETRCRHTS